MKIEAPEENKIVVRLTADDMTKLHITYEEMDYANIETRRVIWTLLDEARRELGEAGTITAKAWDKDGQEITENIQGRLLTRR